MTEPRDTPATIKPLLQQGCTEPDTLMLRLTDMQYDLSQLQQSLARAKPRGEDYLPDELAYRAARTEHVRREIFLRELGEHLEADRKYLMERTRV